MSKKQPRDAAASNGGQGGGLSIRGQKQRTAQGQLLDPMEALLLGVGREFDRTIDCADWMDEEIIRQAVFWGRWQDEQDAQSDAEWH